MKEPRTLVARPKHAAKEDYGNVLRSLPPGAAAGTVERLDLQRPVGSAQGRAARWGLLLLWSLLTVVVGLSYPWLARGSEWLGVRWEAPWALCLLAFVPLLWWRGTFGQDRRMPSLRLPALAAFRGAPTGPRLWLRDLPGVLRAIGFALLVVALARPQSVTRPAESQQEGIDLVLVLDLSGSMEAVIDKLPAELEKLASRESVADLPTRLDGAKAVIRDFISRRKTDRIGVVVFGKEAYVLSPPTLDYPLLDFLVAQMRTQVIDGSATAIGDAVGVGVARLRRSPAKSKAVVLLTDGENNAGSIAPEYAGELAKQQGVKLFTVQLGEGETAKVKVGRDFFGQPMYQPKRFPTNPALLKKLAEMTGGSTYIASDAVTLRDSFHDVLDRLEKTKLASIEASFEPLFGYFLLPGVLLVAFESMLLAFFLRRFP